MTDWALRDQIKEMMIKDDAGRRSQTHFVRRTKRAAAETARRLQAHQRGGTRLPLGPR